MSPQGVVVTARELAELQDVEPPKPLEPGEVLGRTICTLISPGTELSWSYTGDRFPSRPGYSAVFEVEEIGGAVEGIQAGALLFCMGPHRSYQQADVKSTVAVPTGLPPEKAVIARLMGVPMTTLMTTTARPGERVFVTGAGPVGHLAAQIFSHAGYEVHVVEPEESRREHLRRAGIGAVHSEMPVDDASLAGSVGLVLECSGHEKAAVEGCKMVRRKGEVVLVGVPWKRCTDIYAHELVSLVFHKYVVLRSGWEWEIPHQASVFSAHGIFRNFTTALGWLANGRIALDGLIDLVDPRKAQTAYQDLLHKRSRGLFTVFDWRGIQR